MAIGTIICPKFYLISEMINGISACCGISTWRSKAEVRSGYRTQTYARKLRWPLEGDVHMNVFSDCEHASQTCIVIRYRQNALC